MADGPAVDGLVLTCDREGRLQGLLSVGHGVPGLRMEPGQPFPVLFGPESMRAALDLQADLRSGGMVIDRPLARAAGDGGTLYLSGCRDAAGSVLTVAPAMAAAAALAARIAVLAPNLAERLMPLGHWENQRPPAGRAVPAGPLTESLFDEMSRLNNELANAQRALVKANAELAASNEQKNRLMGMMAHDLRTPLQVIAGFAEHLQGRLGERIDGAERSCLERIRESSLFMRHLVEDALSLAALQAGRLRLNRRPTDMARLLDRNVAMNRILAEGKGLTIALSVAGDLPSASVDPAKTEQVMNNLLSNAVKHSDRGGRIRVAAGVEEGRLRIAVADEGRGMSADAIARLFQPFTRSGTLGTAGEGTVGLGLYICRTIVEGHGGRILVESEPGLGSVFTIELPLEPPTPPDGG